MRPAFVLATMWRESRGSRGRLAFFSACLAVGVAAVVGVAALVGAIEDGMRGQSRRLLAADLVVDSRRPLPDELDDFFARTAGVVRADVRELATMAASPGGTSRLAELKVVDGPYPLYGEVTLDVPGRLGEVLRDDTVAAAPDLLSSLGIARGGTLRLGGADFRVAATVVEEPDRLDFSLLLGPRVFLTAAGLARTSLLGYGNRVRYRASFRLPDDPTRSELKAIVERMKSELPGAEYLRFETHWQAQPAVRRALERVESFLGLVALLSLLLGGIGVAQIVRTWIAGRTEAVAVMRSLGLRPREIMVLFLGHVALLAVAASLAGALLGALLPRAMTALVPDVFPPELLSLWQPQALARGLLLGVAVAVLFALPPLTAVWRVSPARVLRADAEPLPAPRLVRVLAAAALAAGVFASAWAQAASATYAAFFTAGLAAVVGALALVAAVVARAARRLPREKASPYLRHGLAALGRPGAGTTGAIVALGLGFLVVIAMALIERRLERRLGRALPEDAPSVFLVDIQPDQWPGVRALLEEVGARSVDSVPVVMARLSAVDGKGVREMRRERRGDDDGGRGRWALTREQRLTWRADLPADNRLVEGELWSDPAVDELSLEEGFARQIGATLGSKITFDVQGIPVELAVTSLRSVEWQSFNINFFLVAEPGVLDDAPGFRLAVGRLEPPAEQRLQDRLASAFPNVTVLRVRSIIERILGLMQRLALGIRILGAFTILAGIAILAGAVASTTLRRTREAAILKTLGVTRRGLAALMATEFGLTGLVAGLIGAAGAMTLAWAFSEQILDLPTAIPWLVLPLAALGGAVLTIACGLLASTRALTAKPLEALRS